MTAYGLIIVGVGFAVLVYTYLGYPLLLAIAAKWFAKPRLKNMPVPESMAIVMAVRNGQDELPHRLHELSGLVARLDQRCEIIVVSDGSTDATIAIAGQFADRGVRVIGLSENVGKAAAISEAVASTEYEIIAFADLRQRWSEQTIPAMIDNFRDASIGGVSGELILEESNGVLAGVGMYWRYEKWIRNTESKFASQIGVTGAIAAVRRECFRSIPQGTILDDVYWPMQVVLQGKRIVFEPRAQAFDRLPATASGEFRRKVRTLAGNFQLVVSCSRLLIPVVNPAWWSFVSHKLMRLVCPWAIVAIAFGCGMVLGDPETSWARMPVAAILVGEILFIAVGAMGLLTTIGSGNKIISAISSFVLLNTAAAVALWCWATLRTDRLWTTATYVPELGKTALSNSGVAENAGS